MLHKPVKFQAIEYDGKIVFEKVKLTSFNRIPKLFNDNESCFMFIDKGSFIVRTPNKLVTFEEGSGMLAKCFNYYAETSLKQQLKNETLELIGVLLYPELVKQVFPYQLSIKANNNYNVNKIQVDEMLLNFKNSINILLDNPQLADEALILNKLREFIILMTKATQSKSEPEFLKQIFSPYEFSFKKTIENNLYASLSLNELAHLCNMSLSSFNRKFKEVYKESPKKYITSKKLEKATVLLRQNNSRIIEVAYDCGFESISTFNRLFQKAYQKSPSQFILDTK